MTPPQDCWDATEDIHDNADYPHVFRYYVARGFIEPGDTVVDVACGYGYGTQILARSRASYVYGIDKGKFQLGLAKKRNMEENVSFFQSDLDVEGFMFPQECDYIVSIETLEHLTDPFNALKVFKSKAKRMLLSVPIGKTTHTNQWHKHDYLVRDEFIKLVVDDQWKLFHSATHGGGVHELFYFVRR